MRILAQLKLPLRCCALLALLATAWPTAAQPPASDEFVAILGRFGVLLPQTYADYNPFFMLELEGKKFYGSSYRWKLDTDQVLIGYADGPLNAETQPETFLKSVAAVYAQTVAQGSLLGEKPTTLAAHPGLIFTVETTQGRRLGWAYLVKNRVYLLALTLNDAAKTEAHVKLLSSFRLLTRRDLEPRIQQLLENLTPPPLPPATPPQHVPSDARLAGLQGQVKQITTEEENYYGTELLGVTKLLSVDDYNEQGDLTKSVRYFADMPEAVRLYGYLNGERVFREKRKSNDVTLNKSGQPGSGTTQYSIYQPVIFKLAYKYDSAGQLTELRVVREDGKELERYNYKPGERKVEHRFDGTVGLPGRAWELRWDKVVSTLDEQGNVSEDALKILDESKPYNYHVGGDTYSNTEVRYQTKRYIYKYEFDQHSNWIKRTTTIVTKEKGVTTEEPTRATYRTILYY
jgi:hypothetical protein